MGLSKELIQQFVKATNDLQEQNSETFVLGTAVISDGNTYVKIDGSESLTPIKTTTKVNQGDRVTVMIKNHTATITGNITSPSVDKNVVENKIDEFGTIIANDIIAQNGKIDNLIAENVTIKGELTAVNAEIENLTAENVNINGKLTANEAEIEDLKVKKLDVETAKIEFATIENLNATNAEVNTIKGNFADFSQLTAEDLKAINANIKNLQAEKLNANEAEIKYANIDFANIGMAAIEKLFADSGIIKDLVVNDQHITGELVGVTIKGDLIEGNTIVADKLVVKGSDGLYYKLNTNGMKVEAEQTEYNSLNGSIITAKSITASKVMVDDLVAFDATIGGFKITDSSIYSGVKESATNTTRGIYLDKTGQVSFGDANNFLKFFKDTDGVWKLAISANSIKLSASSADLETALDDINNKVQNTTKSIEEQFAISNSSTTAPTSGWSTTPPTWQNGKYIWSKTITTYTDGRISESKPVCITGAKGETGASGSSGKGIKSVTNYYLATRLSTGVTESTSGWTTTAQTMTTTNKYLWNYEVITYTDNSTTKTTPVIIGVYGDKGATGSTGAAGNGIRTITEYYLVSPNKTGVTTSTSGWSTTIPTMTATNKYLWNYEVIAYTNGTSTTGTPKVIGVYGDKGATGATGPAGVGIKSVDVEYYLSTSSTTQTGGAWSTTAPSWVNGKYMWSRTKTVTTDGTTKYSSPACITGQKGATGSTGATGATGQGISSITEEYYLSTSKTTQTGGSWVTTPPTWSIGKYMWTRSKIVYKNPTSTVYTTPVCDSSWEAVNEIEVGGRNLLLNSKLETTDKWAHGGQIVNGFDQRAKAFYYDNTNGTNAYIDKLSQIIHDGTTKILEGGVWYSLSFYAKGSGVVRTHIYPGLIDSSIKGFVNGEEKVLSPDGYNDVNLTSNWTRYTYIFKTKTTLPISNNSLLFRIIKGSKVYVCKPMMEKGNKITDWSPAPEDIEKRVSDAELKIEPGKITATVEDQIKKNGSTVIASTSYVIQEANKVIHKFTSTGGYNLIKNGKAKNGTYGWSNNGGGIVAGTSGSFGTCFDTNMPSGIRGAEIKLKNDTDYVYEAWIFSSVAITGSSASPLHYWCSTTSNTSGQAQLTVLDYRQQIPKTNTWTKCYVHFKTKATGNVYFTPFIYTGSGSHSLSVTEISLSEGKVERAWTPHSSEIYEGSTIIDASGVTINNGALTVKNKAGQTVLSGDSDGNLSLTGSLVVSSNKNQILRVDTADTKYPHMVIDSYGPYMDRLSVCSDYTGYAQQKAVDGVFIRNDSMTIYGTGERLFMQGDLRAGGKITTTRIETTSSGQTNNIKIGDDCYIGDFNTGNMFRISGVSNSAHGGIKFGNGGEIKYIGNTQLDFMGSAYFSSSIRVAGHLNPMSTMTVDGAAIFKSSTMIDSNYPFVDFRSPTGTRRGYVGFGAGTDEPLYIVTDINQYILAKGHFCPNASRTYWVGTNNPDRKWKGLCAEGGTVGSSDIRQKENIERLDGTIVNYDDLTGEIKEYELLNLKGESSRATSTDYYEFIKDRFKPSYYNYKLSDSLNGDGTFSIDPQTEYDMLKNVGFLAQDYDLTTDSVAREFIFANEEGDLSYNHMSYVTVGMIALQEAIKKIEVLEERIKQLELC